MEIYNMPRGSGKTTRMVILSEHYEAPIICANKVQKYNLLEQAEKLGIKMPEPITVQELLYEGKISCCGNKILVDESPNVFETLLSTIAEHNIKIIAQTMSKNGNEGKLSPMIRNYDD